MLGGVVLFRTPHRGSPAQKWGQVLANLAELVQIGEPVMMQDVDEESMKIFDMIFDFMQLVIRVDLAKRDAIICFCENQATNYVRKAGRLAGWIGNKISAIVSIPAQLFIQYKSK